MATTSKIPRFGDVIFQNNTWEVTWTGSRGASTPREVKVEKLTGVMSHGCCSYAILSGDQVLWDHPGPIPQYVKDKVGIALRKKRELDAKREYLQGAIRKKYNKAVKLGRIR
jgi:hypothetical protein